MHNDYLQSLKSTFKKIFSIFQPLNVNTSKHYAPKSKKGFLKYHFFWILEPSVMREIRQWRRRPLLRIFPLSLENFESSFLSIDLRCFFPKKFLLINYHIPSYLVLYTQMKICYCYFVFILLRIQRIGIWKQCQWEQLLNLCSHPVIYFEC